MAITLTASAAARLQKQILDIGVLGLRFSANHSGCSGYSYVMDFAEERQKDDVVFDSREVKIFVDSDSLPALDGTEIDYVSEGLNQSFVFRNPRATDECGCGTSFAIDEK